MEISAKNLASILLLAFLTFNCLSQAVAQTQSPRFAIEGVVNDLTNNEPLTGANIVLLSPADSSFVRGTTSGIDGNFVIPRVMPGSYLLTASFVGYTPFWTGIEITDENITGLEIGLTESDQKLEDVRITARAERMEVRGDTIAFNADAYTVNRDASAEDLVRRMPGFTVEGGRVQSQGEDVRRVTVDGTQFFGDDATAALRNLPAEIIQQVEVFDRQSDQAQFTGFNDGNTELTVNIRTRPGMNVGRFGRASSSFGTQERYMGGGNINFFDGPQRVSIIGLTNNMNQQNFSSEDLAGVAQAPARGGGRGGWRGRWGGGGAARNFLTGQQSGVSTVHSFGVNYTDRWNDSWEVNGSYFFNATDNVNNQLLERRFVSGELEDQLYNEDSFSSRENFNHRANARLVYTIDDRNSIIMTPNVNFNTSNSSQFLQGATLSSELERINSTVNDYSGDDFNYSISNTLLYRRGFDRRGRTLSVNVRTDFNNRIGEQLQLGESLFFDDFDINRLTDQRTDVLTGGYTLSTNIQYTEPISERGQLIIGYNPTFSRNSSERDVFQRDESTGELTIPDLQLTNRFDNRVITHSPSAGYRFTHEGFTANASLAYQYTSLFGEQSFPLEAETSQQYHNLLPRAMVMYRFSRTSNMRINYNTNTRTPSANQLQNVIDNTNPLQLSGGNPDLKQQYSHNMSLRFRSANAEKGTSFISFVSAGFTQDFIGSTTFVAPRDTVLADGIVMGRGARLVTPDNTGNAWNFRTFMNYGLPFTLISSNLNLFSGVTYSITPVNVNNQTANSTNLGLNGGFSLSSNISPDIDFSLSYRAGYNFVDNSLNPQLDNNYYTGRARAAFTIISWERLVLASDINLTHYAGLSEDFDANTYYWNASIGYRFLESKALELRFTVVDILAQNNSINRIIEENYVEDVRSNVLSRYAMVSLTYNFRSFPGRR